MQDPCRPFTCYPSSFPHEPSGDAYPYPYPYPSPAQPHYPLHYENDNDNDDNPNACANFFTGSFVRFFFITFLCLLLLAGLAFLIIWLIFLKHSLPAFQLDSFRVSNFSTGPQSVTATCQVGLVASNRDKMGIAYYSLKSSLYYKAAILSEALVRPFTQDKKSRVTFNITFSATNTYVQERLVDDINKDIADGSLAFDVDVVAAVYFSSGWSSRKRMLRISCENIPVGISSNATSAKLVGGSMKCDVWKS